MKIIIQPGDYTFVAAAKTVTLNNYVSIDQENVLLITNVTDGIVIYNFADPTTGGTIATNVLTLEYDTSLMSNSDLLQIHYYDDSISSLGLTDTELRATAIPVSGTMGVNNFPAVQPINDNGGSVTVDGPITNTELRAVAVDVNVTGGSITVGTVEITNDVGNPIPINDGGGSITVDGPLTDTELRFADVKISLDGEVVPVSGTFFQATQPVSAASLPLPTGAATETTVAAINTKLPSGLTVTSNRLQVELPAGGTGLTDTELRATPVPISGTVTSNAGTNLNTSALALDSTVAKDASLTTLNTSVNTLLKPANTLAAVTTVGTVSAVTAITNALPAGTNNIGDVDVLTLPALVAGTALIGKVGIDQTTPGTTNKISIGTDGTVAINTAIPAGTNNIGDVDVLTMPAITGTVTANAGTNLNTSSLALETGGNLASIKAKTDNIPAQGQALAAASLPIVLTAAQVTTLTPPAAITGFATSAKQDTLLTELQLKADLTETQPVSLASVPSHNVTNAGTFAVQSTLASGTNNIGDVDVLTLPSIPAGNNNIGDVDVLTLPAITGTVTANAGTNLNTSTLALSATQTDGTQKSIIRGGAKGSTTAADITSTSQSADRNSLDVQIRTSAGAVVDTFGGGTQYTEDAPAAADPVGNVTILVRQDTPGTLVSTDGDNIVQRGTNYGAAYSQIITSAGAFVDTFGGGSQYADGGARGTATGTLLMLDDGTNIQSAIGTSAGVLKIDLSATTVNATAVKVDGSTVTQPVSGTITANAGTNLNTSALALETTVTAIKTAVEIIDNAIAGSEMQVDVLTMPSMRSLVFATDKVDITGSTLAANSGVDIGDVTINNSASVGAVNVQDGGNSLTVDNNGTFATQLDGAALTSLQLIDDTILADNAGFTDGTTKVTMAGFIYDETAGIALTENDAAAGRINVNRALINVIEDGVTRGRYATVTANNALQVEQVKKATYRASTTAVLVPAVTSPNPWLTIYGSATKTIRIQSITVSGLTLTAVAYLNIGLRKYSTAVSGGTSTALTKIPLDSASAASTATNINAYTAIPTAGTTVGDISNRRVIGQATTAAAAGIPQIVDFDLSSGGNINSVVLIGTAEGIGLYWITAPASTVSMLCRIEYTEE